MNFLPPLHQEELNAYRRLNRLLFVYVFVSLIIYLALFNEMRSAYEAQALEDRRIQEWEQVMH